MKVLKKTCANEGCTENFYDFTKSETRKYCSQRCKRLNEFRLRRVRKAERLARESA